MNFSEQLGRATMGATDDLIRVSKKDTKEHIAQVGVLLEKMRDELSQRQVDHDVSKLEEPELSAYATYVPQLKGLEYGSPEYKAVLAKMKPAVQHHYAANRHHPEFFKNGIDGMNLIDVLEMMADWKAAAIRSGAPEKFNENFEKNIERFKISPQLAHVLRNTLEVLDD